VPDWVEDLSFDVRAGEVLGFAGLVGAGRTEAFEAIIGLRKRTAGHIASCRPSRRSEKPARRNAPRHHVSQRGPQGQRPARDLSLQDNVTLMTLERYTHPLLDMKAGRAALTKADERIRHPHCATCRAARACYPAAISRSSRSPNSCNPTRT
jgi:ribose transport system ATP-binding protein